VRITWIEPEYDGGSPLVEYKIQIRNMIGVYIEDKIDCDGSNQLIKANFYCSIPMETLRASPFNLTLG
jgi:hypothetical protein